MKNLEKLGQTLSKAEQKTINGGANGCPPAELKPFDPNEQYECGGDTGLYCSTGTCCGGYCFGQL
ncbi:hypothetical protein [Olleya sp. Bg11-27]|uniref:hypothetical protein n=1 Tax=Olleya sp. Bg11-27 TaxID=2058135 RepID=UPI000C3157CE|nr:hypothetical protein [Olleya sp. Bg11-27]AUC75473.1 hypothetical protein CW732_07195 [Olleya sp. Bg11-27]